MKCYVGRLEGLVGGVYVGDSPLDPRLDLRNYRSTGFEWGHGGRGPSQLALALLADHFDDDQKADELHLYFKWEVVATLPKEGWTLTAEQITQALESLAIRLKRAEAV